MERAFLQAHLLSGVGHYQNIILRLQVEFNIDLRGVLDFPLLVCDEGLPKRSTLIGKKSLSECLFIPPLLHVCTSMNENVIPAFPSESDESLNSNVISFRAPPSVLHLNALKKHHIIRRCTPTCEVVSVRGSWLTTARKQFGDGRTRTLFLAQRRQPRERAAHGEWSPAGT